MSTVNAPLIKAKLGLRKVPPPVVLARANLVHTGIKENPTDYPAPTPDLATFMKSSFEPASTVKGVSQSLSKFIRKITHGHNSGEFHVTLAAVPGASSYEIRRAPVGADGTIGTWTTQSISNTRPPATITGLTPGTTYAFQVRSLVDSKFSDWSDTVIRVCV